VDLALSNERLDATSVKAFVEAGQPWRILFLSGFSTSDEVSELAGRGIGLSVVKSLVDSYQGTIQVESTLGRGTTFKMRVPLERSV
jgi:two-component system chemotaxis sensor kinase CheA